MQAHAVIIATGAEYRKLSLPNLSQYEGTSVHYAATAIEAQVCGDVEVVVVGGGSRMADPAGGGGGSPWPKRIPFILAALVAVTLADRGTTRRFHVVASVTGG